MGNLPADAPEIQIIEKAIEAEKDDANFYEALSQEINDLNGKSIIKKLAQIERGHAEALQEERQWIKHSKDLFTLHRFLPAG